MNRTSRTTTVAATTTALVLLACTAALPANARTVRDDSARRASTTSTAQDPNCPLRRHNVQLARCDTLTGADVTAPDWIPQF